MKRGTLEHRKLMRLASLLSTERPCDLTDALGIVEAMCNHFAPRSTPQGDIGRCTDEEIALGLRTTRNAQLVVQSLTTATWLDPHPDYRLLIHDWEEHADEAVRKWLIRHKLPWLTVSGPRRVRVRTASRQRRDVVRPPRAGSGTGTGVLSSSSPNGNRKSVEKGKGRRRAPEVPMPDDFPLTDPRRAYAVRLGLEPVWQWNKWKTRALRDDARYANWDRAWEYWCRNAVEIEEKGHRR